MQYYRPERREYVRVKAKIPVKYKYLSHNPSFSCDTVFEGTTSNISGGGVLLEVELPDREWITDLLMQRLIVGVNILLPNAPEPIKALTRVAWIEAVEPSSGKCAMGLQFKEITKEQQDYIFQFIIRSQMPS